MVPEDMYILSADGLIVSSPSSKPYPHKAPKCSDCAPLFMKVTTTNLCMFLGLILRLLISLWLLCELFDQLLAFRCVELSLNLNCYIKHQIAIESIVRSLTVTILCFLTF